MHIANNSMAILSGGNFNANLSAAGEGYSVFVYTNIPPVYPPQPTVPPTTGPQAAPTRAPSEASNVNSIADGSHLLSGGAIAGIVIGSVIFGMVVSTAVFYHFVWSAKTRSPSSAASGPVVGENSGTTITRQNPMHSGSAAGSSGSGSRSSAGMAPANEDEIPARVRVLSDVHAL